MFETFLHDHGIYEEYMNEFRKDCSFGDFLKWTHSDEYIICAFEWDKTKKGVDYWTLINDMWIS